MSEQNEHAPYQTALERHPDMLQLIGTMSVEATNLDIVLARLLSAVLHIDTNYGSIVYLTPKSAYARLEILENTISEATEKNSEINKELSSLVKRARGVIGKRHETMHVSWGVSKENPENICFEKLPFKRDGQSETKQKKELERVIFDTRDLITDVILTADNMFRDWPPYTWPESLQMPTHLERS